MKKLSLLLLTLQLASGVCAQSVIKGKVYDATSREPIEGAVVEDNQGRIQATDNRGTFSMTTADSILHISCSGYLPIEYPIKKGVSLSISLHANVSSLQQVVVTASRIAQQRSEVPAAIAVIGQQTIADAKANRLDYLLNKVSGVFMVNLGNEQHEMSIRQPMTTRSLFLYLEDGIPIRTTGIYNHNAMLEMNMAAIKQIEVIKGPSSSQYGAEAIGGAVNVITQAPPALAAGMVSVQASNNGYKRIDLQAGNTFGKSAWLVSGYYANRNNGPVDQSDYHKTAVTIRNDNKLSAKTALVNSLTYVDYYSDMGGGSLDSAHFARRDYSTLYSFNYRKTTALRFKSQLTHRWNEQSQTLFSLAFRNNSVKQNPSYYVANNFSNPALANGQINNSSFNSYMLIAQQEQKFHWLHGRMVAGVTLDISPSTYIARYIRIQRGVGGRYSSYTNTDSLLSNYSTGITNLASWINYEISPLKRLKAVIAIRYDYYHYNFQNSLPPSASTGAPSSVSHFSRITPKVGLTYNYKLAGFYVNYSQGYVPPQVTELFNSVKVPYLQPQTFFNYEAGGWLSLYKNSLYADYSFYLLKGSNEIISVRLDDGTYQNQNAGKTSHRGIEYGVTWKPSSQWNLRISASNAVHRFVQDIEKGIDYSGNEMAGGPHFTGNAEIMYKPAFVKGFKLGLEWQRQGKYYLDNANSGSYRGFNVISARFGYTVGRLETWLNVLNMFNRYYAVMASKSTYGYTYNLGDPREVTVGIACRFGK